MFYFIPWKPIFFLWRPKDFLHIDVLQKTEKCKIIIKPIFFCRPDLIKGRTLSYAFDSFLSSILALIHRAVNITFLANKICVYPKTKTVVYISFRILDRNKRYLTSWGHLVSSVHLMLAVPFPSVAGRTSFSLPWNEFLHPNQTTGGKW